MENKKEYSISLAGILLFVVIFMVLVIFFALLVIDNAKQDAVLAEREQQIENLQSEIAKLNNTENDLSNNTETTETTDEYSSNGIEKNEALYSIIGVEFSKSDEELDYQYKFLDNKDKLNDILKIISKATIYDPKTFIADFGDIPPIMTIYFTDSRPLHLMAADGYDDDGNIVNLICIYYDSNGSDKTLYKTDTEFAKYIEDTFENSKSNNISKGKEIYGLIAQSNLSNEECEYYNTKYLVIEGNDIYFSNNLSDRIYEGNFTKLSDNTLDIKLKEETQDYAFYTASIFKMENKNGLDFIRIENGDSYILYSIIK